MIDSHFYLLKQLLQKNKIHINLSELKFQLLSCPDYSSLYAITEVLEHLKIENLALELPAEREYISHLPKYFLAHVKLDDTQNFVLAKKCKDKLELTFENKNKKLCSLEEFIKIWSGIVLVVEADRSFSLIKKGLTSNVNWIIIVALISAFFLCGPTIFQSLNYALSIIGLAVLFSASLLRIYLYVKI